MIRVGFLGSSRFGGGSLSWGGLGRCSLSWLITGVVGKGSNIVLIIYENGDDLTKLNVFGTVRVEDGSDVTLLLHLEVDDSLVSLNATKSLTRGDLISDLLVP